MNQLPEDLIFSIFLFCSKTKDVSALLLLNRHWLAVARYEALWRMRFGFNLNDRIHTEEERLAGNQQALKTSRSKGQIRKLKTLSKSHIDEAEKLYTREKVCDHHDHYHENDDNNNDHDDVENTNRGVDFYTGFRFYTIFKKEVQGQIIGKMTEKLMDLMSCSFEKTYCPVDDGNILTDQNPMTRKWQTFIDFVDSNLKPNSEDLSVDQCYMLQKNCSAQFATKFEADFSAMINKLRKYFRKYEDTNVARQEFHNAISNIIKPVRVLTDVSKYRYPIDAYKCLSLAVNTMNFDLVHTLLTTVKEDISRPNEERYYREISLKNNEIFDLGGQLMSLLFNLSYPVENIMSFLSSFIEIFPPLVDELKKKSNYAKFKCDEDALANSILPRNYYSMELSMQILEKAVRDWGYPVEAHFVAKIIYNIQSLCKASDFTTSLRRDRIDTQKLIYLIELYEEVSTIKCDNEIAYMCATYTSNVELCKYFTDTRGFSLEESLKENENPLPYSFIYHSYPSGTDLIEMMEFLVDRLQNFFNYEVADRLRSDPLQRIIYSMLYSQNLENEEKWFRVLRKLLERRPSLSHQIDGVSTLDILNIESNYPHMAKLRSLITEYQEKWESE